MKKMLPVGMDGFEKIRKNNFYFVDKTDFIFDLLNNWGEVNLFTRPRRFGKSLNMSMLKAFFEIGGDYSLFSGLNIMKNEELCEQHMGKYPVISISLKSVDGLQYASARNALCDVIGSEALRFQFLGSSPFLSEKEKQLYAQLISISSNQDAQMKQTAVYAMSDSTLIQSLKILTLLLSKHYKKECIVLIDEYDVPLDKAFQNGYYDEMVLLIRNLFGNVLKGNEFLYFSVLTGCLRISKESIFTGLNNLRVHTITDVKYDEYFGFTDQEVRHLLNYYGLQEHYKTVQMWYDGYKFGNVHIYCPWDVIRYCDDALSGNIRHPQNYWANTSGNGMVRRFIDRSDQNTRDEIEELIAGEAILKNINQTLTYNELESNIENLWSVLLTTGYLTVKEEQEDAYWLMIPNKEIGDLFVRNIREWFLDTAKTDLDRMRKLGFAFASGNAKEVEERFNSYLQATISLRDTFVRKDKKESFYHGILLGLLSASMPSWSVRSNQEAGNGYCDIYAIDRAAKLGIIIEMKYADNGKFKEGCEEAIHQIDEKKYQRIFQNSGVKNVLKYGIVCYLKECRVLKS